MRYFRLRTLHYMQGRRKTSIGGWFLVDHALPLMIVSYDKIITSSYDACVSQEPYMDIHGHHKFQGASGPLFGIVSHPPPPSPNHVGGTLGPRWTVGSSSRIASNYLGSEYIWQCHSHMMRDVFGSSKNPYLHLFTRWKNPRNVCSFWGA